MEILKVSDPTRKKSLHAFSIFPWSIFNCLIVVLLSALVACTGKTTNGKTIIVDVRPEGIWKQGHGKGINIPLSELEKHQTELLHYDTVIFVCETGESAQNATSWMNAKKEHHTVFKNGISWTNFQ